MSKGMEYFLRTLGEITVILWRMKPAHVWAVLGKKPANRTLIF